MNVQVNIANTSPEHFAAWLAECHPDIGATVLPAIGLWDGTTEPGIAAQLWDVTDEQVTDLLASYGRTHPDEAAFGVLDLGPSRVLANPHAGPGSLPAAVPGDFARGFDVFAPGPLSDAELDALDGLHDN